MGKGRPSERGRRVCAMILVRGAAVCHCSVSSVVSEAPPEPEALLKEQGHTAESATDPGEILRYTQNDNQENSKSFC